MSDEKKKHIHFDVVVGNPPYQEDTKGTRSSQRSIYHYFMKSSYDVSDKAMLITPARFLSNAGDTPSKFNKAVLNDPHFKLIKFVKNSASVFPNTDIKGGVAVSFYDIKKKFAPIKIFIPFHELKSIYKKVLPYIIKNGSMTDIIYPANKFNLDALFSVYPNDRSKISNHGTERRLQSNIFKLEAFHDSKQANDIGIYGVIKNKRTIKYISKSLIDLNFSNNICEYKVILPKSNGSGVLGEHLSAPMIGAPMIGYTYTFIGIGNFTDTIEAENCLKYVKSKFLRVMLGILKITQDNTPDKWRLIPLQDFTSSSDIDWNKSVHEIDQQLYKKYGLNQKEIDFIETHVKEMD